MILRLCVLSLIFTSASAETGQLINPLPPADYAIFSIAALALVCFGGLMSGLNVGMLSLDELELEQKLSTGTEEEKKMARKVLPVISNHHWLLVSILLGNAVAGEALPVVLSFMFNEILSVIFSVSFVLVCGEIIPQAFMTGPDQLKIAARLVPLVKAVMYLFFPISYPIAMILDRVLGAGPTTTNFTTEDLRNLLMLHQHTVEKQGPNEKGLSTSQVQLINGAIELRKQMVTDFMIPIEKVFSISDDVWMDDATLQLIRTKGYSRIPIHEPSDPTLIYSILLSNKLIGYEPITTQRLSNLKIKLRRPMYVSPSTSMLALLQLFQDGSSHMAFVTEQPPTDNLTVEQIKELSIPVLGVITLEDVLEKLLDSEIYDESDMSQVSPHRQRSEMPTEGIRITRRVMAGHTPILRYVRLDSYYPLEGHK